MSVEDGVRGGNAERKFWGTPELVENLLPYLDLESIKQLAKCHKKTRQILGKTFVWNQLCKSILPKDDDIDLANSDWPQEDDTHPHYAVLASERGKVRLFVEILSLSEGSDRSQHGMDLLHTICERHPISPNCIRRLVDVGCSCDQTHTVSILGFLLLKEVLASEQESTLCVDRVRARILYDPPLTALSSIVAGQQEKVKKLDVDDFRCDNKEGAEAIATLVERSETMMQDLDPSIFVEEEIGAEGWSAIRRAIDHLSDAFGKEIYLHSDRKSLMAGKREDLKAILEKVFNWAVTNYEDEEDRSLEFTKNIEGIFVIDIFAKFTPWGSIEQ